MPIEAGAAEALESGRAGFASIRGFARRFLANRKAVAGAVILLAIVLVAILAPVLAPYDPKEAAFEPLQGPSRDHLLGTTTYGEDVFSQLLWGARASLVIALVGGFLTTLLALLFGVTAAYYGGLSDHVLSLFTDIFLVLPALPLMIVIAAYVQDRGAKITIAVVVITGWAFGARQLRAQALSLRRREFVEAARARGERGSYIVWFEVLPTMIPLIAATFLGASLYAVLAAAGLEFLGLGDLNAVTWGTMLYWAQNNEALTTGGPLWGIAPGACIALLGASFALLNYAFDEIGNPALRAGRVRDDG
jgi:peptide/nickel transport system permease protein